MLEQVRTMPNPDTILDHGDYRIRESARRLFQRLNPAVRDPFIAADAEALAVYDWEIAGDTDIELKAVRSALRLINGKDVVVEIVNEEHRVTALIDQ